MILLVKWGMMEKESAIFFQNASKYFTDKQKLNLILRVMEQHNFILLPPLTAKTTSN